MAKKKLFLWAIFVFILWLLFRKNAPAAQVSEKICYQLDDGSTVCEMPQNVQTFIQQTSTYTPDTQNGGKGCC